MSGPRGYFEIGIYHGKTVANLGTLWRSAYQLGAAGIFTVGHRYQRQPSDTCRTEMHVPLREYQDADSLWKGLPRGCQVVGVEMGGRPLPTFAHPDRALYLLGAEDGGVPHSLLDRCHHVISLPTLRSDSYNVAVAGALVMYDRATKRDAWSPRRPLSGITRIDSR